MRNRAKCKKCGDIIESFHGTDYVFCKCGHIAVDGGEAMRCSALDWDNFVRVDDEGNEVIPKIVKIDDVKEDSAVQEKPTKTQLLGMLEEMIKTYEALPQQAMTQPITHYDLLSLILVLSSILRCNDA